MLWHNVKTEIKILRLDNGFVVEWTQAIPRAQRKAMRGMMMDDDETFMGERRGMEIIETEAALLKRLKELV